MKFQHVIFLFGSNDSLSLLQTLASYLVQQTFTASLIKIDFGVDSFKINLMTNCCVIIVSLTVVFIYNKYYSIKAIKFFLNRLLLGQQQFYEPIRPQHKSHSKKGVRINRIIELSATQKGHRTVPSTLFEAHFIVHRIRYTQRTITESFYR